MTLEFVWLAMSTAAFQASRLGTGIVAAAALAPTDYAVWGLVLAILSYSVYFNFGVASGLNRELPILIGAERPDEARRLEDVALAGTIGASILVLPAVAVLGLVAGIDGPALVLAALAAGAQQFYLLTQTVLRSRLRFNRASLQQAALAVSFPVMAVLLLPSLGVVALLVAQVATFIVGAAFAGRGVFDLRPRFRAGEIIRIMRVGMPIMAGGLAFAVLTTADRWLTLFLLGQTATGQLTFAALLAGSALLVSLVLAQQQYPRMAMALGRGEGPEVVLRMAVRQSLVATGLVAPLAIALGLLGPPIITAWIPDYEPSSRALPLLAAGFLLLAAASGFTNFLVVIGRARIYLGILLAALAVNVTVAVVLAGLDLVGMAIAAGTAYGVVFAASAAVAALGTRR